MIRLRLLIGLFLILLGACTSVQNQGTSVQNQDDPTARAFAQAWLALVDSGQYGKAYDQFAASWKNAESRERLSGWTGRRGLFGAVVSRQLISAKLTHQLPASPDGTYEILHYRTSFQRKANTLEEVVVAKESGRWVAFGYHFK